MRMWRHMMPKRGKFEFQSKITTEVLDSPEDPTTTPANTLSNSPTNTAANAPPQQEEHLFGSNIPTGR